MTCDIILAVMSEYQSQTIAYAAFHLEKIFCRIILYIFFFIYIVILFASYFLSKET